MLRHPCNSRPACDTYYFFISWPPWYCPFSHSLARDSSVVESEWFIDLFRIQLRLFRDPDPIHFIEALLEIIKKITLKSIKKENLPTICHFLFHTIQSYSLESSGLKLINKILIYLLFQSWGSGPRKKFQIRLDPDPLHCVILSFSFSSWPEPPQEPDTGLPAGAALLPARLLHHLQGHLQLGTVRQKSRDTVPLKCCSSV